MKHCDTCNDNGPGIKGNSENHECDECTRRTQIRYEEDPYKVIAELKAQLAVYRDHKGFCKDCEKEVDLEYYNSECTPPLMICKECGQNVYPTETKDNKQ